MRYTNNRKGEMITMIEKLKEFLEIELHYTKVGLDKEDDFIRRADICWYARQRGFGAAQFANVLGAPYNEVEAVFEWYCERLEEMENALH